MRLFRRGLILAGLICLVAPASARALPLLVGSSSDPASCEGIVGSTTLPNCSLFSLGVLTGSNTLEIEFGSNADVALFEFTIAADSDFLALTSSLGLDTMFGLFDSTTKSLSSYFDADNLEWQAFGANIDAVNLNRPATVASSCAGTYYLAVLLDIDPSFTNGFGGGAPTSLAAPVGCDDAEHCAGGGGTLTLQVSVGEQPAPVPEPGTLALMRIRCPRRAGPAVERKCIDVSVLR